MGEEKVMQEILEYLEHLRKGPVLIIILVLLILRVIYKLAMKSKPESGDKTDLDSFLGKGIFDEPKCVFNIKDQNKPIVTDEKVIGIKKEIALSDIIYIATDPRIDHRNKIITLKNGEHYVIINYSFDDLIKLSPDYIKVNKSEMINANAIDRWQGDTIYLKFDVQFPDGDHKKHLTLSRECRPAYEKRFKKAAN